MITLEQLFGPWLEHPDATSARRGSAALFLLSVNRLLKEAEEAGIVPPVNPRTQSQVSGETLGGFRPQSTGTGAPNSAHKLGRAVDVYDPQEKLEDWLDDETLKSHGLYREAPAATIGWVHLTDRAPPSGRRTFMP